MMRGGNKLRRGKIFFFLKIQGFSLVMCSEWRKKKKKKKNDAEKSVFHLNFFSFLLKRGLELSARRGEERRGREGGKKEMEKKRFHANLSVKHKSNKISCRMFYQVQLKVKIFHHFFFKYNSIKSVW